MNILETRNLTYIYPAWNTLALDNINFRVKRGERIAVLGANGAGKSTLFKHFNGILMPTKGEVIVKGRPVIKKNLLEVRKTVGLVFQNPDDQIFAPTVEQDVAFGPMNLGLAEDEISDRVEKSLRLVGMDGFNDRSPHHLSNGQKKRVAIAGILAMEPEIMVLDEPTAGLDPHSTTQILHLIARLNKEMDITIIFATHDVDVVPMFAHKVCILHHGRIVAEGTPHDIFADHRLIKHAHLRLPIIAQFTQLLQQDGVPIDVLLTIKETRDALLPLLTINR
jgi:cobalt/nickel transport system ATP-binding protein